MGEVLRSLLGFYGTVIIGLAILGTAVILRTPWTLEETAQAFVRVAHAAWSCEKDAESYSAILFRWSAAQSVRLLAASARAILKHDNRADIAPVVDLKFFAVLPLVDSKDLN